MSNLIGKTLLNRYTIREFLGRGGMAEVYKVWDSERMSFLAMKVLHEDLALDKVFVRRFAREAQNLERLQHPNIVRFYGFEKKERFAFMLMDYIEGETLKHLIHDRERSLPLDQFYAIMQGVFGALHYAHQNGVVHCDIKPANIMVNRSGNVQLADFGIARMSDAATTTMVGAGTPAYMAPEQIRGKDPTPQSDIYALGIVLYEMLTGGERPFTGEQAEATGGTGEKVRWEHLHIPPPSPRQWNRAISPELERVVLKALAKDPSERYPDILAFSNALGRAIADEASEETGTAALQTIITQNLSGRVIDDVGISVPHAGQVFRALMGMPNQNLLIAVLVAILLVAGGLFMAFRPNSNLPEPTAIKPSAVLDEPMQTITLTPQAMISPAITSSPLPTATFTLIPTDTPVPTSTFTLAPSPTFARSPTPAPILSVDFVNPAYVMDYVNDPDVPPIGQLAKEYYSWEQRSQSNITLPFTISMESSQVVFWRWFWCATTQNILDSNMKDFTAEFTINGEKVPRSNFVELSFTHPDNGQKCAGLATALKNWTPGKYELIQRISYDKEIYDGIDIYEPGSRTIIYTVTVSR